MTANPPPATENDQADFGPPVLRFAPSPNGELHLGHALSALTGYDIARRLGGRFLVRIEDIDLGRCRPEYIDGIFRDLEWLGVAWDGPVWRQSERFGAYEAAARKLAAAGLLYPCFASRSEIQLAAHPGALDPDGAALYSGLHRHLSPAEIARRTAAGDAHAMRLHMEAALRNVADAPLTYVALDATLKPTRKIADPSRWGDAVLQRKDVPTSYHLAVVVDDAAQGITHVVRGLDLLAATDLHALLQALLGLPTPIYHHHRLITDTAGRKLAKSLGDTSLAQLRDGGLQPDRLRQLIGLTPDR